VALFLLVVAVAAVGLTIMFGGTYWMNRAVDKALGGRERMNDSNGRGV
jgi:hypothetical protein